MEGGSQQQLPTVWPEMQSLETGLHERDRRMTKWRQARHICQIMLVAGVTAESLAVQECPEFFFSDKHRLNAYTPGDSNG